MSLHQTHTHVSVSLRLRFFPDTQHSLDGESAYLVDRSVSYALQTSLRLQHVVVSTAIFMLQEAVELAAGQLSPVPQEEPTEEENYRYSSCDPLCVVADTSRRLLGTGHHCPPSQP